MASQIDEQTSARLDLLVAKQVEIDDLRLERDKLQVEHARQLEELLQRVEARKMLLLETGEICRRLMEVPEVWDAVPDIGTLLVKVREELGTDVSDSDA